MFACVFNESVLSQTTQAPTQAKERDSRSSRRLGRRLPAGDEAFGDA